MRSDGNAHRGRLWGVAVVVLTLASGGCAGGGEADIGDEVTNQATEQVQSDSETGELITPRPGMADLEPVRIWLEYGWWEGDHSYVMFPSQGAPCEVLDHIDIEDGENAEGRRVVTLYQGHDPDIDPAEPCDGPTRPFTVVLPAFERPADAHGLELVNGADQFEDH